VRSVMLELETVKPWHPHAAAAPLTERNGDTLAIAANGTRTCVGGWQLDYAGVEPGTTYRLVSQAQLNDVDEWRDRLQCLAYWGGIDEDRARKRDSTVVEWDYLLPERDGDRVAFDRTFTAPEGAKRLSIRYTFRWTPAGSTEWTLPDITIVEPEKTTTPSAIAVVTGQRDDFKGQRRTTESNIAHYTNLCEQACSADPDLIVLPEIAVQYGVEGSPLDLAVPAPGPETERFSEIAKSRDVRILLGLLERDGDAVHNTALLIGPDGEIDGRYRKVHLAVGGEMDSGILPGEDFPVFETEMGRIGCNICMDSSAAESSRMMGLNGADFLLLPIMGDHRAWHPEDHTWDLERFRGIMQTRAMDNQLCVVVAVNRGEGSCVIDRVGHVLAWNDGTEDTIQATVDLADGWRPSSKGSYEGVNWMQRRPHTYGAFTEDSNVGSLQ
jgi:predicted amidohydrolase